MSTPRPAAPSFFERLGRATYRFRWPITIGWALALLALLGLSATAGGEFDGQFKLPGAESQVAGDLLTERFPAQAGSTAQIAFKAESGSVTESPYRERIEAMLAEAATLPSVGVVDSPFDSPGQISPQDGQIAFAVVHYGVRADLLQKADVEQLVDLVERTAGDGLQVNIGGDVMFLVEMAAPGSSELIGIAAAAVILVLAFGSFVAMGVPIITAVVSLGVAASILSLLTHVLDLPEFTTAFAAMIGLGVGIDYALFVITRFREGLHRDWSVEQAIGVAVDTAGRSVLFAGAVVMIALSGLMLMGIPALGSIGLGAALVVGMSVVAALTLLPAVLGILGRRVDRLSVPGLNKAVNNHESSVWYRISGQIQRRPWVFLALGMATLGLFAAPVLDLRQAFTDAGNNAEHAHSRKTYDLLAEGFGPGFNGPFLVVFDVAGGNADVLPGIAEAVGDTPGIVGVTPIIPNPTGDTALLTAYPAWSPQSAETEDLVHTLREEVLPAATEGSGVRAYVTGSTAGQIDVSERIESRTIPFFLLVIGLSFVLLMSVFRSVLIPVKAAIFNAVSIAASLGVVVAVFQWGWLAGVLGIDQTGPIEPIMPMMMFAILFGLSMDYEVFLVSRIHEEYVRGETTPRAISLGMAATARVITSAALIMIAVFGSFISSDQRIIKEFGLGLAVAILIDATIVRLLLVPTVMQILGRWNWWLPNGLKRVLPRFNLEGSPDAEGESPPFPAGK